MGSIDIKTEMKLNVQSVEQLVCLFKCIKRPQFVSSSSINRCGRHLWLKVSNIHNLLEVCAATS